MGDVRGGYGDEEVEERASDSTKERWTRKKTGQTCITHLVKARPKRSPRRRGQA